ncbi:uncharacterized protein LOC143300269 [Babylonia areolata]|uniref:uncharacterized protein LOC143300269 n=1 Tax=Babylonia areolata TaxID=304850 RepID=UPI003FD210A5
MPSVPGFPGLRDTTATNSILSGNFSHGLATTDSQDVDLEALNLSRTKALMPTIVYLAVLMFVGVVGNTVVFLVYYKRFKPSATRTYILAMSVCDLLVNVLSLPSEIIDIRFWYTFDLPVLCMCIRCSNSFLVITSAFLLVAVARDRFKKICRPAEKQRSLKRIKLYVLICVLASLALSVVFAAFNGSRTVPTGVGNVNGTICSISDRFKDTMFSMVYYVIMTLCFLACVTIMIVCYIRIGLELCRHRRKQKQMSKRAAVSEATPAKDSSKAITPIVEDASPGSAHQPNQSATDSWSTAELISLKPAGKKNVRTNSSSRDSASSSHKHVLLPSVKNLNHEEPSPSVEDSEMGSFSGCSVGITITSADLSNSEQAANVQEGRGDSGLQGSQSRAIHQTPDMQPKTVTPDTKSGCAATVVAAVVEEETQKSSTELIGATSPGDRRVVPGHDSPTETSSTPRGQQTMPKMTPRDDIQPANEPPPTDHHAIVDSPSSLQHRPLTPRGRHQSDYVTKDVSGKRVPCRIPKKRGNVKSIPSSTTLMMFVLTSLFIVNYLPHLIVSILRALSEVYVDEGAGDLAFNGYSIALRSYFVNSAANSIVYGFCSARFRRECRLLCRPK